MSDQDAIGEIERLRQQLAAAQASVDVPGRVRRIRELAQAQEGFRQQMQDVADERAALVVQLYELTDMSYAEVGKLVGLTSARIGQLVAAARARNAAAP